MPVPPPALGNGAATGCAVEHSEHMLLRQSKALDVTKPTVIDPGDDGRGSRWRMTRVGLSTLFLQPAWQCRWGEAADGMTVRLDSLSDVGGPGRRGRDGEIRRRPRTETDHRCAGSPRLSFAYASRCLPPGGQWRRPAILHSKSAPKRQSGHRPAPLDATGTSGRCSRDSAEMLDASRMTRT